MKTLVTNFILLILGFGIATAVIAQENNDEKPKGEVKVKIITSVNGDTNVVEKAFQPGDVYVMEELNDSFPEFREMTKFFNDSLGVFSYNYSFDFDKDMEKLEKEMEKLGEKMEFELNSEEFEKEMEELQKEMKFEWNSEEFEREMEKAGVEIEQAMKELSKTIVIDGDEIRSLNDNDENITVSENGDTIKISVRKEAKVGDEISAGNKADKKVKVIVIEEEESDGKAGEEPEIKVIKKVIRTNDKGQSAGMNNTDEAQALKVFPNPSSGKVTVQFKPDGKKKMQLKITDEAGKTVYTEEVKATSEFSHEIDLGNEAKGIYFVEITQGKNKYINRIMLK